MRDRTVRGPLLSFRAPHGHGRLPERVLRRVTAPGVGRTSAIDTCICQCICICCTGIQLVPVALTEPALTGPCVVYMYVHMQIAGEIYNYKPLHSI